MFESVATSFGGYVDDVGQFLSGLFEVDEETVGKIMGHLERAQELMPRDGDVDRIPGSSFGTLPANYEMDVHSTNARDYLMGALGEMLTTLGVYDDGVLAFRDSVHGADDLSAAEMLRIARATNAGRAANSADEEA